MRKFLRVSLLIVFALLLVASVFTYTRLHDRYPGYKIDLSIARTAPSAFSAGFSSVDITPAVIDNWVDMNEDGRYNPADNDYFRDRNANGRFDAVWLAGFHNSRPAIGINDRLWARCMVLDDGRSRLAIVSLDLIGHSHEDVIRIRKLLPAELGLTYTMVGTTHTHEGPDFMGLWGPSERQTGRDEAYVSMVIDSTVVAIKRAVQELRPAYMVLANEPNKGRMLHTDTRKPYVTDHAVRLMQLVDSEKGNTLGTLMNWGNHPETTWDRNLYITSDFPHYYREYLEKGIHLGDSVVMPGLGGTAVYISGAIGGLMTTTPDWSFEHPMYKRTFTEPSFEKAEAQGMALAVMSLDALKHGDTVKTISMGIKANTVYLPLDNNLFRLAALLKIVNRGLSGWMKVRTEIAHIDMGESEMITFPGELYPEILHGGIETPPGADFPIEPLEVPSLDSLMSRKHRFHFGLMNDALGYIIPKSEWDTKAPFIYESKDRLYGEINSLGPRTAEILHQEYKALLQRR
jgi:hypothetical protein